MQVRMRKYPEVLGGSNIYQEPEVIYSKQSARKSKTYV